MNCSDFETRIDAFVDGELNEASRDEVRRHLEHCAACRAAVDELRDLLDAARALPRSVEPPRDLLPELRSTLSRRASFPSGPVADPRGGAWLGWAGLAASLLILFTATLIYLGREAGPAPGGPEPALPASALPASAAYLSAEEEYLKATEQLLAALQEQRGELPPETAAVLEKNLRIIDEAIAEVKQALESDPADSRNAQFLTALHRQKIQLLWRASRLSS
jgi:hypothetical protein